MLCFVLSFDLLPLYAMDMEEVPLLQNKPSQEVGDTRIEISQEDEEEINCADPVLFDGSRRFFNANARNLAKKRAFKEFARKAALSTLPLFGASFGVIYGINLGWAHLFCLLTHCYVGDQNLLALSSIETSILTLVILAYVAYHKYIFIISERNPFKPIEKYVRTMHEPICLSQAMIDAANSPGIKFSSKKDVTKFLNLNGYKLFKFLRINPLRRLIFSRQECEAFSTLSQRLTESPRDVYRNLAFQIKKKITEHEHFSREVVVKLFSHFQNQNILEHMLSHAPQAVWNSEHTFFTEREYLALHKYYFCRYTEKGFEGNEWIALPYCRATILAQNGWISFSKTDTYPIHCYMKYFDIHALPPHMNYYWHDGNTFKPNFYMPYSLQLAQYYKFEEDPAYAIEYETPSNSKIKRLLEYRQEIISQRNGNAVQALIENNNNN